MVSEVTSSKYLNKLILSRDSFLTETIESLLLLMNMNEINLEVKESSSKISESLEKKNSYLAQSNSIYVYLSMTNTWPYNVKIKNI